MDKAEKDAIIKWFTVIAGTIALGIFVFTSELIPEDYRYWFLIADFGLFFFANFQIVSISTAARERKDREGENRAARRQAERMKK
jgi:hypothetical protein